METNGIIQSITTLAHISWYVSTGRTVQGKDFVPRIYANRYAHAHI